MWRSNHSVCEIILIHQLFFAFKFALHWIEIFLKRYRVNIRKLFLKLRNTDCINLNTIIQCKFYSLKYIINICYNNENIYAMKSYVVLEINNYYSRIYYHIFYIGKWKNYWRVRVLNDKTNKETKTHIILVFKP